MDAIEFDDVVDESRELKLSLPADFPLGKVHVTVEPANREQVAVPLEFKGLTLGEIMKSEYVGSWADLGIEDSQVWVDEVRQRIQERRE